MTDPKKILIRQILKQVSKQLKPAIKKQARKKFLQSDGIHLPPHLAYIQGRTDQAYDILLIILNYTKKSKQD